MEGFDSRIFALSPASWAWIARQGLGALIDNSRVASITRMQLHAGIWFGGGRDGGSGSPPTSSGNFASPRPKADLPLVEFDAHRELRAELALTVEQSELLHAGRQALAFLGVVRNEAMLERLEPLLPGQRARSMLLSDGTRLNARLILGCDGAQSTLRSLAGFRVHRHDFRARAVVANFVCEFPHRNIASQWFTEEGIVALLPLPGRRVSLVWSAPEELASSLIVLAPDAFAARVQQRCHTVGGPCALGQLRCLAEPSSFALVDLQPESPIAERVALLADAAHVVHPMAGMGLNLGLGDLAVLADLLASRGARHDPGQEVLLARYRRARREAVLGMSLFTRGLHRLTHPALGQPLVRSLGWAWSAVAGSAALKSLLVAQATGHGPYRFAHQTGDPR
jgi:ubiquinone biosynthesis UbiH/UbiF/VisC/COQ6 family hydroxylase